MASNEFLKLLGLIIDKLSEKEDSEIDLNDEFIKYLESNGYANSEINKAFNIIKRLIFGRDEKEVFYFSEEPFYGTRIYSPEETYLYKQGSLKRLLILKENYMLDDEIVEEVIDILLGLSSDEDLINEEFVDSLLHAILLDYGYFERLTGIRVQNRGSVLPM